MWVPESINWDEAGLATKKWIYDSVTLLEAAIRADFVQQCAMTACRAGDLNFSPTISHVLSALFSLQFTSSPKTHEFII